MKCRHCQIDYPRDCVEDAFIDGECVRLCGQCALEVINAVHETDRKQFDGQLAEAMRQRTLAYRKREGIEV